MNPECESAGIALRTGVEPDTLEVTADPNLVEQALINLVRNAAEALAGRDQPRIDLNAALDRRGRVLIRVQDNGPGILDEVQDRIFIPRDRGSGYRFAGRSCACIAVPSAFNPHPMKKPYSPSGSDLPHAAR